MLPPTLKTIVYFTSFESQQLNIWLLKTTVMLTFSCLNSTFLLVLVCVRTTARKSQWVLLQQLPSNQTQAVSAVQFRHFHFYPHEICHPEILFSATVFRRVVISLEPSCDWDSTAPWTDNRFSEVCIWTNTRKKKHLTSSNWNSKCYPHTYYTVHSSSVLYTWIL